MQRTLILLVAFWLSLLFPQDVSAFVPLKGESNKVARRPPTASSSGSNGGGGGGGSSTALHAVAKKKKAAAKNTKAEAAATKEEKATSSAATKKLVASVNKSELVAQMADQCGLTKTDTEAALNAFLEVVQQNVAEGKKVSLVGFGSFVLKERAARKGRNPQTGEELDIPASKAPGFTVGKAWKDRVNGK